MNLIGLNPTRYPYSVAQLRADEPQLSLSADPHDGELAALSQLGILVARVQPTERPADTREQRAEEGMPEQDGDTWRQTWTLRDATAEELAAWDAAHAPQPDWVTFKAIALNSSNLNSVLVAAYGTAPVAAGALAPSLLRAEQGDIIDFAASWAAICAAVPVSPQVITGFATVAQQCNLPPEFIAALEPSPNTI